MNLIVIILQFIFLSQQLEIKLQAYIMIFKNLINTNFLRIKLKYVSSNIQY